MTQPTVGYPPGSQNASVVALAVDNGSGALSVASQNSGVPIIDCYLAPVAIIWNASTALNATQVFNTAGMDCVALTILPTGTITAGAVTFEVYDGFNWFAIKSARESSYNTDSVFNAVGASQTAWTIPCAAYPQFRIRLSTQLTGTTPVLTIGAAVSSAPDTSVVTAGLDPAQAGHPGLLTLQAEQVVAIGAASAASAAVQGTTNRVFLSATAACWVAFGSAPTAAVATAGSIYVPANVIMPAITVTPGVTKIANIEASSAGFLSIIESL
jgi:hypothetical protein